MTGLPPTGLVAAAALGAAAGMTELAGPEPQDLVDMARRTLAAGDESLRLVPTWRGPFGVGPPRPAADDADPELGASVCLPAELTSWARAATSMLG